MSESVQTTGASPPDDLSVRYASLLASGERVLLARQRHWLTFLEAGRWFVLALGQSLGDDGISASSARFSTGASGSC